MPSTSAKQHRFMAAIAHSPSFAKKVGVSQSVGKDFDAADKGKTFKKGGMMKKRRFDEGGGISGGMPSFAKDKYKPRGGETRGGAQTGRASNYKMPTDTKKAENADRISSAVKDATSMSAPGGLARRAMSKFGGSDTEESLAPGQYRLKKGGMMKKRKFDEGGETSAHEIDSDSRRAHGLYDEEPTPKSAAKVVPKVAKRKMDDMGAQNVSANKSIADKSEMGPQEDTGAVTGMASRKYKFKGTDADKERNATNLAKELVTTAALGGVGKLGQAVYRVGKAANVARHFGEAKQLAAPEAAAWKEFAATPRKAIKTPSGKKFEKQINSGEIALKKGGDVKNFKNLFKGKETYGEEMKEAKAIKSGKITPKQYAMGEESEKSKKFAKGGSIRRMADGGMTAPMAPPMPPQQPPIDPRKLAAMQAAMQAQGGAAPMAPPPAPMPPPAPGMKRGGSVKYAKGGGIESRGKTKGTIIRMAMGGSVSSASRRADGIAQRGKTKC